MRVNKNIKLFLNYLFGPLIFCWLAFSLYQQIRNQDNLEQTWQSTLKNFQGVELIYLLIVILLMFVNWGIESFKWKLSVTHVHDLSLLRSFKAIFSGVSFSVITPNRVGEYLGRIIYMPEGKRLKVISLTILSSMSQLIITIIFGLLGILFIGDSLASVRLFESFNWLPWIWYGGWIVLAFLTVFYFRLNWISGFGERFQFLRKYRFLFNELGKVNATMLLNLLSLSLVRYLVFGIQYYLLFRFFEIEINWVLSFWSTAILLFTMAFIPTVAIFEVVKRAFVATAIFKVFTSNLVGISFVTTSVWFINLVIPAMTGSLLILRTKIFRERNVGS